MIGGSCGFREPLPSFGSIQVLGKENIQPDILEVRLAEVLKKMRETAVSIKAVYEMIDKRAISPVTCLGVYSYSLFLGISKEEMTVSDTYGQVNKLCMYLTQYELLQYIQLSFYRRRLVDVTRIYGCSAHNSSIHPVNKVSSLHWRLQILPVHCLTLQYCYSFFSSSPR